MDTLTLGTIAAFAGGTLLQGDASQAVRGIGTDSRVLTPGELFLALRGEKFDGHDFVPALAARGVPGAIVADDYPRPANLPPGFALIAVADTLLGYHRIAAAYRETLALKVIAITGSNGKTSTKDLTAAVLGRRFRVFKTEGNFNNHIGVPRTLLRASAADKIAVIEMGMNHPGELAPLARMARPDIAIITNIGSAHLEFMGTRAAIAHEKGTIAEAVGPAGCVILPANDEFTSAIARRTSARVVLAGLDAGAVRAENFVQEFGGSRFRLIADGETVQATMPILGRHMVANALLAVAAGLECGLSLQECSNGLAEAQLTKGRLEQKTLRGLRYIDDTYNANPDSMVAALETLVEIQIDGARIAVLGKMGELGAFAVTGYRQVGEAAARLRLDRLIGVGAETNGMIESARAAGLTNAENVADVTAAKQRLAAIARPADLILLKGSRSAAMERILTLDAAVDTPPVPAGRPEAHEALVPSRMP